MPAPPPSLLRLDGVTKRFPGEPTVLSDVSLAVGAGEIVTLIGPSGCGKSTILRLAAGLESVDAGTVEAPSHGVGFVFQDATLMPWASALDNVALPLRFSAVSKAEARARARVALDGIGLAEAAAKRPRELSGGMRMRVAVARAMVGDPSLLLMDEPFAALDEITRFRLVDDLLALRDLRRLGILFVTHSIFEAVSLADRILVMSADPGRIATEIVVPVAAADRAGFRETTTFARLTATVSRALATVMAAPATLDETAASG
ncbi:MAG: ATP-binding cassette domain-containing protein [Phyllobacteriaceae bacterium]|nr:ATP-binding cassette domain-containing protein [Phyllobacteriaceae bacterium]